MEQIDDTALRSELARARGAAVELRRILRRTKSADVRDVILFAIEGWDARAAELADALAER